MADRFKADDRESENSLIQRLRSDDHKALQVLLRRYWDPLVRYAGRLTAGSWSPEDPVQDTFARLWNRRHRLKDQGSLRALLYTMVRNACLDERRREARRTAAREGGPPPQAPHTPWEDVQGAELERAAARAVSELPARRREVFRLVREEGLTYQEVAEVMDLAPQTVANHMSLAMADLRTALKPFLFLADSSPVEHPDTGRTGSTGCNDGPTG